MIDDVSRTLRGGFLGSMYVFDRLCSTLHKHRVRIRIRINFLVRGSHSPSVLSRELGKSNGIRVAVGVAFTPLNSPPRWDCVLYSVTSLCVCEPASLFVLRSSLLQLRWKYGNLNIQKRWREMMLVDKRSSLFIGNGVERKIVR